MKNFFKNKSVLITGGTGSFGVACAKKILSLYNPKKVIIFSRDELKQFELSKELSEETYQTLKMMKQNLFPFPVSFSKVVGYATDKLNEELLYAKEKAKKEKTK